MGDQWYCERGSKRIGPFSPVQLKQLAREGKLQPADLLWKEGMTQAVPARRVGGLFPGATTEVKAGGDEASSMSRSVANTARTSPAADAIPTEAPRRPDGGNDQVEFIYRISPRLLIPATLVLTCAGAFFVYLALFGNVRVFGFALPAEIGKPILWAFVLIFFFAPLQGVYFLIRDRSNPRRIVLGSDRLMVPQTDFFNRARIIPYASIAEVKRRDLRGAKVLSIKDAEGKVELVAGLLPNPADLDTIQSMLEQRWRRR